MNRGPGTLVYPIKYATGFVLFCCDLMYLLELPDSKVHGANMGPPDGTDRTQVGPMLAPWTLLSGRGCMYPHSSGALYHFTCTDATDWVGPWTCWGQSSNGLHISWGTSDVFEYHFGWIHAVSYSNTLKRNTSSYWWNFSHWLHWKLSF